ncbi:MAG: hypothetical protein GY782_09440 [Gammaproteobacteria bacterium]|nr:hypothetical protein [Gammaproteobacteria bacterium]
MTFFHLHKKADHFDQTFQPLLTIWEQHPEIVQQAFAFIQQHQLEMWQWLTDTLLH